MMEMDFLRASWSFKVRERQQPIINSIYNTLYICSLSQRIQWKKQDFASKCTSCLSLDMEAINDCEKSAYMEKRGKVL